MPIRRGDCTVHNERVMHGSGGNLTAGMRRAYIVAFRSARHDRHRAALGFTHSHNDSPTCSTRSASPARHADRGLGEPRTGGGRAPARGVRRLAIVAVGLAG